MKKIKLLFLVSIIGLAGLTYSCKSIKESKKVKQAEKEISDQEKEAAEQHQKLVEAHYNRQAPKTKIMMEKTKTRSESFNRPREKKRTLFQRIFGIKKKHKKPKLKNK